ncbi:MAG: OmpA family protein, partial [Paracoccaceae bacterium]
NQKLSEDRAKAVLAALQTRDVSVDRLTAFGYGEGRPLADNGTREGRETNRRIEFTPAAKPAAELAPAVTVPDAEIPAPTGDGDTPTGDGTASFGDPEGITGDSTAPTGDGDTTIGAGIAADETAAPTVDAAVAGGVQPTASGPDFSADTSPSVAPTEVTKRPKPRPDQP